MRDRLKHFPVNWIDGMKINKDHFIKQDEFVKDIVADSASLAVSPLRYGILPPSAASEDTFNVTITLDNQNTLKVSVISCQAVTAGGVRISLPAFNNPGQKETNGMLSNTFQFSPTSGEAAWWVILVINPYDRQPAGSPDLAETPPRFPHILPGYDILISSDSQFRQYEYNPYALTIGKISVNGNDVRVEDEYIPPCFSISAHPDLISLHNELDQFFGKLEIKCSQIVQKIYKKKQQNDISELVLFLCDRMVLHLSQSITEMRWLMLHEQPAALFAQVASLARVMKNTIDMRIGSGKEEMMNYLSEWCELKQGELETMLSYMATIGFEHHDMNRNIQKVITFVKVTDKLFETLNKLEFIGKRKESGIFVKEEQTISVEDQNKARRRFFG